MPVYEKAKTLEIVDSVLYLGNLKGTLDIGYQPFANAIELEATTKLYNNFEDHEASIDTMDDGPSPNGINRISYRYPNLSYMHKGYTREEVYAFYIVWVLNDGRETYAYHIPGRTSSGANDELIQPVDPTTWTEQGINDIFNYHVDTKIDNTLYTNNMGYWENKDEKYPTSNNYLTKDVDVAGTSLNHPTKPHLQGAQVRHHHFPSNHECEDSTNINPIVSNSTASAYTGGVDIIDECHPVNWHNENDPTNLNVIDWMNNTPVMGNRIEINGDEKWMRFEVQNTTDYPGGGVPYYETAGGSGDTTWWDRTAAAVAGFEFVNVVSNNAAPSADEVAFVAALASHGIIDHNATNAYGVVGFIYGYTDPYGFWQHPAGTTVAQGIANPLPYLHPAPGVVLGPNGAVGQELPPYSYKAGCNDHANCVSPAGTAISPYGYNPITFPSGPPRPTCACCNTDIWPLAGGFDNNASMGAPDPPFYDGAKADPRYQMFPIESIFPGVGNMPNYLDYDISFSIKWIESGTTSDPSTDGIGPVPSDVNILGFHLNNIKIPAELYDKVQGFRVYRAERDWDNKRVWGQSPAISMRSVGIKDKDLGLITPVMTNTNGHTISFPWPDDPLFDGCLAGAAPLPNATDAHPTVDSANALYYPKGYTAWIRTAQPESLSPLFQFDHGSLDQNLVTGTKDHFHYNSGFTLYDFTLLRQLKNIRPVSYLKVVHYVSSAMFHQYGNQAMENKVIHVAKKYKPKSESRVIKNRALTYQGAGDLIGARGAGFSRDIIIGSGFDNFRKCETKNGYTSITVELQAHDPDWALGTFPSADESFLYSDTGFPAANIYGWEDFPMYDMWTIGASGVGNFMTDGNFSGYSSQSDGIEYAPNEPSCVPITNIMSLKYNVYSRWNTQKALQTGYFCPKENFDPRNSSATFSTKQMYPDGIFGGDTFICRHGTIAGSQNNYTVISSGLNPNPAPPLLPFQNSGSTKHGNPPPYDSVGLYLTLIESTDNINFRYDTFDNSNNAYKSWPSSSAAAVLGQSLLTDQNSQVAFGYDEVYSQDNDVRFAIPLPFIDDTMEHFPNRIIKSAPSAQTKLDSNRIFLAQNFKDISSSRGSIQHLINFSNLLYIHCERSLFATKGKQSVQLTDTSEAFVGSGDIFAQEPSEVISVYNGYGGRTSFFGGVLTRYGYFFADNMAGKIFSYNGELEEISKAGVEKFISQNSGTTLSQYGYPRENIFQGVGATLGWDPEYDRVLVTILDYIPTSAFITGATYTGVTTNSLGDGAIKWDSDTNLFYVWVHQIASAGSAYWDAISFDSTTYFTTNHFTLSYYPEYKMWASYHSYHPYMYFNNFEAMFSHNGSDGVINNVFWDHKDDLNPGRFYANNIFDVPSSPFEFEFVVNTNPGASKLFYNISYDIHVNNPSNDLSPEHSPGFDSYFVYNSKQIFNETGIIPLTNCRVVDTTVYLNQFRDDTDFTSGNLPNFAMFTDPLNGVINNSYIDLTKTDPNRSRFVDKYLIIRLKYSNSTNNLLNLYSANAGYRQNHR